MCLTLPSVTCSVVRPSCQRARMHATEAAGVQFTPTHEGTASVHVLLDGTHVRGSPMPVSVHRDVDALARGALTGKLSTAVTGLRRGLTTARRMHNQLRAEAEGLQQYVPVLVQVRPPFPQ